MVVGWLSTETGDLSQWILSGSNTKLLTTKQKQVKIKLAMKDEFIVRDLRNGDWYWANKIVLEYPNLKPSAKLIYNALAYYANNQSQSCFPSITRLASLTGLHKDTVSNCIKILEEKGFIKVERKSGENNQYVLLNLTVSKTSSRLTHRKNHTTPKRRVTHPEKKGEYHPEKEASNNNKLTRLNNKSNGQAITGKEFNDLIALFEPVNPSFERLFSNKSQRTALERLVKKHGVDKITWVINLLPRISEMPYSPTVTTPYQLEVKLGEIIAFLKKEKLRGGGTVDARNIK